MTANDYMKTHHELCERADSITPKSDAEPCAHARKMINYHLRIAARFAKEIAEHLAASEKSTVDGT